MIQNAVALGVPDFEGAKDGTNPFRLHGDACKYGVGVGIFQLSRAAAARLANTHYMVLGVAPVSTQAQIMEAGRAAVKAARLTFSSLDNITKAVAVLTDVKARATYD